MISSATKRRTMDAGTPSKRRNIELARLCDLRDGVSLFANEHNALRAKEKGYIRSREASTKYEELERKLFTLYKESGDMDFPNEDWVFQVLPELSSLENDTLDALLYQAATHAKYERAARELVQREKARLDEAHEHELRALRAEAESESTRHNVSSEMRLKAADEQAREDLKELRGQAGERIEELEGVIEELEGTVATQQERMKEMEEAAEAEAERLREEAAAANRRLHAAVEETDLKRETSRKLKEEIIDNDRLTVANLNRIKQLESLVEQHKAALEEVEGENNELRSELAKSIDPEVAAEQEAEVSALRELLNEREGQILSLTRRLSDALEAESDGLGHRAVGGREPRRDSFLERFHLGGHKSLLASGA